MIAFTPNDLITTFNSIPLESISNFNKNEGYPKGAIRIYQDKKYEALTDIPKTVNLIYSYEDSNNIYAYNLYTEQNEEDLTSIDIVNNETLIYTISNDSANKKYFKATSTGTIDLTSEDFAAPTNFTDLGVTPDPLYRINLNYPNGRKDTLYWKYLGATNRETMFDGVLNRRSINDRQFTTSLQVIFDSTSKTITLGEPLSDNFYELDKIEITGSDFNNGLYKINTISVDRLTITIDEDLTDETITSVINFYAQTYIIWEDLGIDKIAIFNTLCDEVELKVYVDDVLKDTYNDIMSDSSFITTFELFVFNQPRRKTRTIFTMPKNYNQKFELTFKGLTQEIGEVLYGSSSYIGKALDNMTIDSKTYNNIIEAANGDVYFEDEVDNITVLDKKTFDMLIDSFQVSAIQRLIKSLIGRKIVLSGSVGDENGLDYLLSYGFTRDSRATPERQNEKSKYKLEIREFK